MYTTDFWKGAGERAAKTAAQTALPALAVAFGSAADFAGANWADFLVMVIGATILSVLTSLVSAIGDGNPSLGNVELTPGALEVAGRDLSGLTFDPSLSPIDEGEEVSTDEDGGAHPTRRDLLGG